MINTLLVAASIALVSAQNLTVQIFHVPVPPNYPLVVAPDVPVGIKLTEDAVFNWDFGGNHKGCTTEGKSNVDPCVGRIADFSYDKDGTYTVTLTITDSSLKQPIVVKKPVKVFKASVFPVAQRPEIRSVSQDWLSKWHTALYRLKFLGVYDHFIRIHISSFQQDSNAGASRSSAHGGPAFLPWHRTLTYVVERAIATAIGDDSVGMPYWDWMQGIKGLEDSMGPNGDQKQGGLVTSGPFCFDPSQAASDRCPQKWQLPHDYPGSVKSIERSYGSDSGFSFQTQAQLDSLLNQTNYDEAPFSDSKDVQSSFRSALEGWAYKDNSTFGPNHNGVHRYVGGTMGKVSQSFNDPLFIIHHCQVDRMFTMWQQKKNCADGRGAVECYRPGKTDQLVNQGTPGAQQVQKDGKDAYIIQGHMYDSVMWPWTLPISAVLRAENGYKYLQPNQRPADPKDNRLDATANTQILANGTQKDPNLSQGIYPPSSSRKSSAGAVYLSWLFALPLVASLIM